MKRLIVLVGVALLFACSHERRIKDVAYQVSVDANPGHMISELENRISTARKNQVDILSPTWFESACISLNQAKDIRDSSGDVNDISREVAEGTEQLKRAEGFADVSRKELADVIKVRDRAVIARQNARGAGAARLGEIQDHFKDADADFVSLTEKIEDGKAANLTEDKPPVMKKYAAIETLSVKKEKLDAARRTLDQAIREGAKDYAPKTLASAQNTMKAAESFINNSPTQQQAIDEKSADADFYATRALNITREAKRISERKPEETALWVEDVIVGMGNQMGTPDNRNRRFDEQLSSVHDSVKQLQDFKTAGRQNVPLKKEGRM